MYLDVFSRQYIKSLELLQNWDNSDANKASSSSQKSSQTVTNTSKNSNEDKDKKRS